MPVVPLLMVSEDGLALILTVCGMALMVTVCAAEVRVLKFVSPL